VQNKPSPAVDLASVPPISPALRRFLYFTAGCTGAAIMIVEILGAKMLAPYLGTSHFVWTAQIAVTLVALAFGYYVGGRWVDRSARLGKLYWALVVAAAYLALTVAVCEPVAYACLKWNLALGSLGASAFLFFVPLSLLAMVGPFFVRVLTSSVGKVGGNMGRLTAVSTIGSFLGTLAIGYLLVPFFPNSLTMYGTSLGLMVLALVYCWGWGRRSKGLAVMGLVILASAAIGAANLRPNLIEGENIRELFRGNSHFGLLQVLEVKSNSRRHYVNDYLTQNTYDTAKKKSFSMFTYMLHGLARAYASKIDDVLCIGLGVGIVPMQFAREGARVDVAEINPDVVPLAQRFFDLEPEKLNLFFGDGRYFVDQTRKTFDAVVLDAFLGDSNPSHLMTREAFAGIRRILKPEGVLVINTFAGLDRGEDFFGGSLYKTLAAVFPSVRIHKSAGGNTLYVASPREKLEILNPPTYTDMHPEVVAEVREAFNTLREPDPRHGRILTDDYNPVEFYDAKNREQLRRNLAVRMRRL
jgi:spermidine synthase